MHASRSLLSNEQIVPTTASHINTATTSGTILFDAVTDSKSVIEDSNMKYVHLVSAPMQQQEASTSYSTNSDNTMITTTAANFCNNQQELYSNTPMLHENVSDGSIVEYVIDNHQYVGNTMYVEVLPEMNASMNGIPDHQSMHMNSNGLIQNNVEFSNIQPVEPVKKSRYSRMSSEDRERYNARRRERRREKKRLLEEAKLKMQQENSSNNDNQLSNQLQFENNDIMQNEVANQSVIDQDSNSNTSLKPSSSKNRYSEMTEEQRKEYNAKKAAAYRKKKEEEEMILSNLTDKSIPSEQSSQAQDILLRNARRAERARLRYQRLTPEERREYNMRRTLAKRAKKEAKNKEESKHRAEHIESFASPVSEGGNVSNVSEEALSKLERDVIRRTMAAQMHLKQKEDKKVIEPVSSISSFNSIDETIDHVATYGPTMPLNEQDMMNPVPVQEYVEQPSTLPLVFVDQNGNPTSLPEGTVIEIRQEHPNGPQTIIIHTTTPMQAIPDHNTRYVTTNNVAPVANSLSIDTQSQFLPESTHDKLKPISAKSEAARLKRAERARQRYHNMSEEVRKEFNAKRSLALKKSRLRDEELCRLNEQAKSEGRVLDSETQKAVLEALARRAKRAESARLKYQRMTADERRTYNANRDAIRKAKKQEEGSASSQKSTTSPESMVIVVDEDSLDFNFV